MNPTTDIKTGVERLQAGLAALQEIANGLNDQITTVEIPSSNVEPTMVPEAVAEHLVSEGVFEETPTQTFPPCTCIGGKAGTPHRYLATSPTGNACAHYIQQNPEKFSAQAIADAAGMVGAGVIVDDPPAVVESASTPSGASKTQLVIAAVKGARSDPNCLTKSKNLTASAKRAVIVAVPGATGFLVNSVDYKVKNGTIA